MITFESDNIYCSVETGGKSSNFFVFLCCFFLFSLLFLHIFFVVSSYFLCRLFCSLINPTLLHAGVFLTENTRNCNNTSLRFVDCETVFEIELIKTKLNDVTIQLIGPTFILRFLLIERREVRNCLHLLFFV